MVTQKPTPEEASDQLRSENVRLRANNAQQAREIRSLRGERPLSEADKDEMGLGGPDDGHDRYA